MDVDEAMRELKALGTSQNRKVHPLHGAKEPLFAVSWANLRELAKRVGQDQALAQALWDTEKYDAPIFATMVAEPAAIARFIGPASWASG